MRYLTTVLWVILPEHNDNSHDIEEQRMPGNEWPPPNVPRSVGHFLKLFDMYMSYCPVISSDHAHRTYTVPSSWRHTMNKKQKLSSVAHAHRVTGLADINIDAVRKQRKAEYNKQYRLKRKLLLQQQASKDIYMIRYLHP
jgi:hypothetical protein